MSLNMDRMTGLEVTLGDRSVFITAKEIMDALEEPKLGTPVFTQNTKGKP